jgi:hypothetical protein
MLMVHKASETEKYTFMDFYEKYPMFLISYIAFSKLLLKKLTIAFPPSCAKLSVGAHGSQYAIDGKCWIHQNKGIS